MTADPGTCSGQAEPLEESPRAWRSSQGLQSLCGRAGTAMQVLKSLRSGWYVWAEKRSPGSHKPPESGTSAGYAMTV